MDRYELYFYRTEPDAPDEEDNPTLDCLGLKVISDKLAELLLPGLTENQSRIDLRIMSLIAFGLQCQETIEGSIEGNNSKDKADFWEAFEWLAMKGFVDKKNNINIRVPGKEKVKNALATKDGTIKRSTYLANAKSAGFHGQLKSLAEEFKIESNGNLGERGKELIEASKCTLAVDDICRYLIEIMKKGECDDNARYRKVSAKLALAYNPKKAKKGEKELLKNLFFQDSNRERCYKYYRSLNKNNQMSDQEYIVALNKKCPDDLKILPSAILKYEVCANILNNAFVYLFENSNRKIQTIVRDDEFNKYYNEFMKSRDAMLNALNKIDSFPTSPIEYAMEWNSVESCIRAIINKHQEVMKSRELSELLSIDARDSIIGSGETTMKEKYSGEFVHTYRVRTLGSFYRFFEGS